MNQQERESYRWNLAISTSIFKLRNMLEDKELSDEQHSMVEDELERREKCRNDH